MAGDYILNEETAAYEAPKRLEKVLKTLILLAVLVLGGKMIWLMGITPVRPFSRIEIAGYTGIPREQVLAVAGITANTSFFSVDIAAAENALMSLPAVYSVRVFRHFPDRLQIVLQERRPVAAAFVTSGGRTLPVFFDSQGVIFRIGGSQELPLLPVISGVAIENPVPGMRLPAAFGSFFRQLERISLSSPELLAAVSEIRINPRPFGDGFDLTLYPIHWRIPVRVNELNEATLRYTLLMVDVLVAREPGIASIDFRSSIASYVLEGGVR